MIRGTYIARINGEPILEVCTTVWNRYPIAAFTEGHREVMIQFLVQNTSGHPIDSTKIYIPRINGIAVVVMAYNRLDTNINIGENENDEVGGWYKLRAYNNDLMIQLCNFISNL